MIIIIIIINIDIIISLASKKQKHKSMQEKLMLGLCKLIFKSWKTARVLKI